MWIERIADEGHEDDCTKYEKITEGGPRDSIKYKQLLVGTHDRRKVTYIALLFNDPDGFGRVNQYFFKDDKPSAFNLGFMSGLGWPLNRPPFDGKYRSDFSELAEQLPSLKDSLERCVALLEQPGPEYQNRDGGVVLKLDLGR